MRRQRFGADELAAVLSHYDLGIIEEIRAFPRGSRKAPKVRIRSRGGDYILKRRAPGRDDPGRVTFAHGLQLFLEERGYPVTSLIGTRDTNDSMLRLDGGTYELFTFVPGGRGDGSAGAAKRAGEALGLLHELAREFRPPLPAPTGGYHAAAALPPRLALVPAAVRAAEPGADPAATARACRAILAAYREAADRAADAGFGSQPREITHGDWHPGNIIERAGRIAAVLDFDSARREPRVADLANAVLQFSMPLSARRDPAEWPDGLDVTRMAHVVRGYGRAAPNSIDAEEFRALPWLMIEALIVESVVPIAATGAFGRLAGSSFLQMVGAKVAWLAARAADLVEALCGELHHG